MNKLSSEAKEFAIASRPLVQKAKENNIDLGVAPTYLSLAAVKENASKDMIVEVDVLRTDDHFFSGVFFNRG